jgi:hypothetical protein
MLGVAIHKIPGFSGTYNLHFYEWAGSNIGCNEENWHVSPMYGVHECSVLMIWRTFSHNRTGQQQGVPD